jgi:hypothetical protein
MAVVRVSEETMVCLVELVEAGLATSLGGAVAQLCRRVTELEAVLVQRGGGNVRSGKRERVSLGSDESSRRAVVSEPELGKVWTGMPRMKQALSDRFETNVLQEALGSSLFPSQWGALLLQLEENPARGLSRVDAACFLVSGWNDTQRLWQESCVAELVELNAKVGKWAASGLGVEQLGADFVKQCPKLNALFGDLVTADTRVAENKKKTADYKRVLFVVLFAALGKVRSKHLSACGTFLYRLWRELGASNALNDCLATLGLSISSKRGSDHQQSMIAKASQTLIHHTKKRGAGQVFFASCDNVDQSFKTRAQQVGSRDECLHFINATLYRFSRAVPASFGRDRLREDELDISVLFATAKSQAAILDLCTDNLARVLFPLIDGLSFKGKPLAFGAKAVVPALVSLGLCQKTEMFPLPTQNYSESKLNEFVLYEKNFLAYFQAEEKVLVTADAKTYLLMKKSQNLRNMEAFRDLDCDDNNAIPVPDWFHLSMCVFLGECTRSNLGLVKDFCKIMGPSYVINANVSKSFNDSMRVFGALYPVAVARLFQYF